MMKDISSLRVELSNSDSRKPKDKKNSHLSVILKNLKTYKC